MKTLFKFTLTVAILIAIGFFFLNLEYFWQQIRFVFVKPAVEQKQSERVNIDALTQPVLEANMISIPSLGITAPIVLPAGTTEDEYQEALKGGVAHFPGTAKPGEFGNVYLFGHSSDYPWSGGNYKTVFALLPQIALNADIFVSGEDGKVYRYVVKDKFVAKKTDTHLLDQRGYKEQWLTVQTSYPIGTALQRYIVTAQLAEE